MLVFAKACHSSFLNLLPSITAHVDADLLFTYLVTVAGMSRCFSDVVQSDDADRISAGIE